MRGALDRFFPQAPYSLFANDPVGYISSTYRSPSQGLASRGPASPGEQDHLEPLPLNSWVCTTHHHHPEMTQPQKGYPLWSAGPLGVERSRNLDRSFRNIYIIPSFPTREQHAHSVQNARSRFTKLNQ